MSSTKSTDTPDTTRNLFELMLKSQLIGFEIQNRIICTFSSLGVQAAMAQAQILSAAARGQMAPSASQMLEDQQKGETGDAFGDAHNDLPV